MGRININELTLEEKIGQMMMVGMDTNCITDRIENLIENHKIGGIILYRKNFSTYEDLIKLINDLKKLNQKNKIPLLIAVDQEGGRVNRMPKEFKNLPAPSKIVEKKDIEMVRESAKITAEILSKTGFNMNFAPVLDIKNFSDYHAIGDRAFGTTKEEVIKNGVVFMKELQKSNVISVIKHFPGHGATKRDSHFTLPIITKSMKKLIREDMVPFQKAIENGADAVLVGHLLIRNVTGIYPASLSRYFIGKYLRNLYHFNGLVITDDLKMRSIRFLYGEISAFKKAFMAGNDIVVFRYNKKAEEKAIQEVLELARKGKLNLGRINRSVKRILKIKEKYEIQNKTMANTIEMEQINHRIQEIRYQVLGEEC